MIEVEGEVDGEADEVDDVEDINPEILIHALIVLKASKRCELKDGLEGGNSTF